MKYHAHTAATQRRLTDVIRWGLGWAAWFVAGLEALAIGLTVVRALGAERPPLVRLYLVLLLYLFGGAVGGVLLGVLRPATRSRGGATLVGVLIACVVYLGMAVVIFGKDARPAGFVGVIIGAVITGGAFGRSSWNSASRRHYGRRP